MAKYYLTEKGKLAKTGFRIFLRDPMQRSILKYMQKRKLKRYSLAEIQRGTGYGSGRKQAVWIAQAVRAMRALGYIVRQ